MPSAVTILNKRAVLARLARIAPAVQDAAGSQLRSEVIDLAEAQRRAAPTETVADPGHKLRDSVHAYLNPDRPLSYKILADAKDENGNFIGKHVEHGHKAKNGAHVPAAPFFFPTYRARRKGMRSRIKAAAMKAIKQLYPG